MAFSDSEEDVLVICSFLFSLVSLMSSTTVILYYVIFKGLRKEAFKLVVFTAVSDAIRCLGNLMGSPKKGELCQAQGIFKTFGGVASFCWVGCMAYTIHLLSRQSVRVVDPKVLLKRYHYVSWPVATVSAFLPLIFGVYGPAGGWCWITTDDEGVILRWTSFYGILWFFFAWICYVYISLWWYLRGYPKQDEVRKITRLWVYPVIILFCYGPASVRRIWDQAGSSPPYWLAILHICLSSLHGTLNALAYGRNEDVQLLNSNLLDLSFGSCLGLRRVGEEQESSAVILVFRTKLPSEVDRAVAAHRQSLTFDAGGGEAGKVMSVPDTRTVGSRTTSNVEMTNSVDVEKDNEAAVEDVNDG